MVAQEYLLFALKLLKDRCTDQELKIINQYLPFLVVNQSNSNIWLWLSFLLDDYLSNRQSFEHTKWVNSIPIDDNIDISTTPQNRPLIIYQGRIFDLTTDDIFINFLSEVNVQNLLNVYDWSDMLKAEILLAVEGNKVSRTTLPIKTILEISKQSNIPLLVGYDIFQPIKDAMIDGFSNASNSISVLSVDSNLEQEGEVYIYFSKYYQDALLASVLDNYNLAGKLLMIPDCCAEFFKKHWNYAVEYLDGDMAFFNYQKYFTEKESFIKIAWQVNVHAMYLGGGLTWHFPCTHRCTNTIALIDNRFEQLKKLDYDLANRLLKNQKKSFYLTKNRQIHTNENSDSTSNLEVNII